MTKSEKKQYFRERRAMILEKSKKQDQFSDTLIRNLQYEEIPEKKNKSDVVLQPRISLGKLLIK